MSKILNGHEFLKELLNPEVGLSDFEVKHASCLQGSSANYDLPVHDVLSGDFKFRRKEKTRVINGFTVPAPLREIVLKERYYLSNPFDSTFSSKEVFLGEAIDIQWLNRGLCFATKEAAIANAKAMCGINPEE